MAMWVKEMLGSASIELFGDNVTDSNDGNSGSPDEGGDLEEAPEPVG